MSANIFSKQGQVAVVALTADALPVVITLFGYGASSSAFGLLTSAQGENVGGHQFMHTLNNFIYLYVFGERIGTITIGGKAIIHSCSEDGADAGITAVSDFYAANRISNAIMGSTPKVIVDFGGGVLVEGFLVKYEAQIPDPDSPFMDFKFTIKTIHS